MARRFSAPTWERPAEIPAARALAKTLTLRIHFEFVLALVAPMLPECPLSEILLRVTSLSIVLVFAAGPSASLLCDTWCNPNPVAVSECHHTDNGSTRVSDDNVCGNSLQGSLILVKDDRRRVLTDGAGNATAVAQFSGRPLCCALPARSGNPGPAPSDLQRPLTTPLRI